MNLYFKKDDLQTEGALLPTSVRSESNQWILSGHAEKCHRTNIDTEQLQEPDSTTTRHANAPKTIEKFEPSKCYSSEEKHNDSSASSVRKLLQNSENFVVYILS